MKLLLKTYFKRINLCFEFVSISLVTLLLIKCAIILPLSFAKFNPSQNIFEQYNLMDMYWVIHENGKNKENQIKEIDNDIVIVDFSDCHSRDSIAEYLNMIKIAKPKLIGIDLFFRDSLEELSDSKLVDFFSESPENIVVVNRLSGQNNHPCKWKEFDAKQESFFQIQIKHPIKSGFDNIIKEKGLGEIVHSFAKELFLKNNNANDTILSFTSEIAKIAMPDSYNSLKNRNNDLEYIDFTTDKFDTISVNQIFNNLKSLESKIILVGSLNSKIDKHPTPINAEMSGIKLQAYILSTIKDESYIKQMSEIGAWVIAFLAITFVIVLKFMIARKEWQYKDWVLLFIPVFQIIILFIGLFIGYWIFITFNYYIPLIYTLIGVGIVRFPYNLYYKIKSSIHQCKYKKK